MKRFFALIMMLTMLITLIVCFANCGKQSTGKTSDGTVAVPTIAWPQQTTASTTKTVSTTKTDNSNIYPEPVPQTKTMLLSEQVLFEKNGVKATAKEYVNDSIFGEGIKILFENNSDQDVSIWCMNKYVNDVQFSGYDWCKVSSHKKVYNTIYIDNDELIKYGLGPVGTIKLSFEIRSEDASTTFFKTDLITLETTTKNIAKTIEQCNYTLVYQSLDKTIEIYYLPEISTWKMSDGKYDPWIRLYFCLKNKTDKEININIHSLSIDDFEITDYFYCGADSGYSAFNYISLYQSDFEEIGIYKLEDVHKIELSFDIYGESILHTIDVTDNMKFSLTTK